MESVTRLQVDVVDDHVRMGDVALVVVVVDDGHLVVAEALLRPSDCELTQAVQRDLVLGVGGDDVVLVGAGGLSAPWFVTVVEHPGGVHLPCPVVCDRQVSRYPLDATVVVEVEVVGCKGAVSLGEIAADARHVGVT